MLQRTWIWEGYYEDTEANKQTWLDGAHKLRSINVQVVQDLEDKILLNGFRTKN